MPLYKIQNQNTLAEVKPISFSEAQLKERKDLQALLRDNPVGIDPRFGGSEPSLMIISEEFSNWQDSLRRVDLLALEREEANEDDENDISASSVNLVVIELKAVEEGGHLEPQAIRYAAMLSTMKCNDVITAYEKFLAKLGKLKWTPFS